MAIIYSYPLNDNIKSLDELVGTTQQTINGQLKTVTRNFLLADIAEFLIIDGGIQKTLTLTTNGTSGVSTLDQLTGILNIPHYPGELKVASLFKETFEYVGSNSFTLINAVNNVLQVIVNTTSLHPVAYSVELPNIVTVLNELYSGDTITIIYNYLEEVVETPNLQSVTDEGNTTTNSITADSFIKIDGSSTEYLMADGSTSLGLGYTPVNKAGDTMLGDLILNEDPSTALGAATKQYVDNIVTGINFHAPVVVATDISLVATYDNGVDGVGATLTGPSVGVLSIDGEFPAYLDRILVWQQADPIQNGIYDLTTVGDSVTVYQLTRSADADNSPPGEIHYGDYTLVLSGDTNGGFGFICNTPGTIDIGTTPINYVQFNAAQAITVGYGLQELTPNVISINPLETQEKITLTTTGTGVATLVSNTLNIPESTNYWTKTGNNITPSVSGIIYLGASSGGINQASYNNATRTFSGSWVNGSFGNGSIGIDNGTDGIAMFINNTDTLRGWLQSGRNLTLNTTSANGFIDFQTSSISKLKLNNNGTLNYSADYSSLYVDRTLIDKGYLTSYTTAQLAGKMNNPSLTASYIPKALTATTIGNSRLLDINGYLGIDIINTPSKDITFGYLTNREIGIEESSSVVVGRDLKIQAGRTTNYSNAPFTYVTTIGASMYDIAAVGNDVYILSGSTIYKRTGESGSFISIQTLPWGGNGNSLATAPNGDLYAAGGFYGGDIYKLPFGGTTFSAIGSGGTQWSGITVAPDSSVYVTKNSQIYKQSLGTGPFVSLNQISRSWGFLKAHQNGNIYASVYSDGLYMQTAGAGDFVKITTGLAFNTSFSYMLGDSNGDFYAVAGGGLNLLYKQTAGTGNFVLNYTAPATFYGLAELLNKNVYSGINTSSGAVYVKLNNDLGTPNLQGGTLKLNSGTGKGTGASDIEMYTGQVLASGTDMQTATLRAKIDNTGLMTLPSVTNALIEADTTGKAIVTKEYVNNRLVVETTSGYTLTNADSGGIIIFKTTAAQTLTIPTGLTDGFECTFVTLSGVTLTVSATGVTLNNNTSTTLLPQLSFTLKRMIAADTYIATGNL